MAGEAYLPAIVSRIRADGYVDWRSFYAQTRRAARIGIMMRRERGDRVGVPRKRLGPVYLCTKCKCLLKPDCFGKDRSRSSGLNHRCKKCDSKAAYQRKRRRLLAARPPPTPIWLLGPMGPLPLRTRG